MKFLKRMVLINFLEEKFETRPINETLQRTPNMFKKETKVIETPERRDIIIRI